MRRWLAAIVAVASLCGCGANALQVNAQVATAMLEVQVTAGDAVRSAREADMLASARAAFESGAPEEQATAAAQAADERWQCAVDGHRLYQSAVGAYIDAVQLWSAGRSVQLTDALPFVRRALDAYRAIVGCLDSLGSEVLPRAPAFLDLFPAAWELEQ